MWLNLKHNKIIDITMNVYIQHFENLNLIVYIADISIEMPSYHKTHVTKSKEIPNISVFLYEQ